MTRDVAVARPGLVVVVVGTALLGAAATAASLLDLRAARLRGAGSVDVVARTSTGARSAC